MSPNFFLNKIIAFYYFNILLLGRIEDTTNLDVVKFLNLIQVAGGIMIIKSRF